MEQVVVRHPKYSREPMEVCLHHFGGEGFVGHSHQTMNILDRTERLLCKMLVESLRVVKFSKRC